MFWFSRHNRRSVSKHKSTATQQKSIKAVSASFLSATGRIMGNLKKFSYLFCLCPHVEKSEPSWFYGTWNYIYIFIFQKLSIVSSVSSIQNGQIFAIWDAKLRINNFARNCKFILDRFQFFGNRNRFFPDRHADILGAGDFFWMLSNFEEIQFRDLKNHSRQHITTSWWNFTVIIENTVFFHYQLSDLWPPHTINTQPTELDLMDKNKTFCISSPI